MLKRSLLGCCGLAWLLLTGARDRCPGQLNLTGHRTIAWAPTWEAAQARARLEQKPILLLQMFGRLDDELC